MHDYDDPVRRPHRLRLPRVADPHHPPLKGPPMRHHKVLVAVPLIALALAAAGCGTKNPGTTGGAKGEKTIAFVPKLRGIPYFEALRAGGDDAAKKRGG